MLPNITNIKRSFRKFADYFFDSPTQDIDTEVVNVTLYGSAARALRLAKSKLNGRAGDATQTIIKAGSDAITQSPDLAGHSSHAANPTDPRDPFAAPDLLARFLEEQRPATAAGFHSIVSGDTNKM